MTPALLALVLASLAPGVPAGADPSAAGREPEQAPRAGRGGWRHGLGVGPHSTTFRSRAGSRYTFHSASLGYRVSHGARGPFLDAWALLPLQARQDGNAYATASYYLRRWGGDLLAGWQWRWAPRGGLEAEAGPGLHATAIVLPGKPGYRDFSALPLGIGAGGTLWWRTGAHRLSRVVVVGAYAGAAWDFYDPMHADDLTHGFTARLGVALGLGARR